MIIFYILSKFTENIPKQKTSIQKSYYFVTTRLTKNSMKKIKNLAYLFSTFIRYLWNSPEP